MIMMIIIKTANNNNNFKRKIHTLILDVRSALSVEGGTDGSGAATHRSGFLL